ncbi:MAG: hypothetical protein R3272_07360, partial [Candidatus Promineifilaceae bacterium]|nr:hypothetical protein [Candidatus Promineifilaceae bacterium]
VVGGVALLVWQRQWKGLVLAAVALVLSLLPLVVIWNAMFGAPLVVPYEATEGESFLRFLQAPRRSWWVLRDLFRHSPLLLLSVAGFFFLWRLNRLWTLLAGSLILAQAAVNGAVLDWWAGDTYGMRRMTELFPFYVLLTAAALGYMPRSPFAPRFRLRRYVPLAFRLALVLLLAYSFCYMVVFFNFHWTNPDQLFITSPEGMFRHVLNQAHRWEVTIGVWRSHLGPWAWSRPGP